MKDCRWRYEVVTANIGEGRFCTEVLSHTGCRAPCDRASIITPGNGAKHEPVFRGIGTSRVKSICEVLEKVERDMKDKLVSLGATFEMQILLDVNDWKLVPVWW